MKKLIIVYFFVLQTFLYACATCTLMIPTAHVDLDLIVKDKKLTNVHVKWKFSDMYSDEMLKQYDKNQNDKLDKNELNVILQAMNDYLIPKDMLTKVQYANYEDSRSTTIKPEYKNFDIKVIENILVFTYDSYLDLEIKEKMMLSFLYEDDESFFSFITSSVTVDAKEELYHETNLYLFTASMFFSYSPLDVIQKEVKVVEEKIKVTQVKKVEEIKTASMQENLLKDSINKIKSLFESIKDEKNPLTYMFLLFFAYLYGAIHALGPGHGKTLVGSYFLSNDRSYSKAFFISLAIGVVHTFSAFLLTLIIYYVVDTFLAKFLDESIYYTTKISALVIISIALYLLYKKYKAYKIIQNTPKYSFSENPHAQTCACNSCKVDDNSTDMALIISAGIIPCPGTITIFIFSLSLGLYYAGFLSAFVMSLGMSTVIFISALISVAIRKKTSNYNTNIKKYLEYASLGIILILGLFLLIA
ncbi:MAG: nickel/cobalt exporter [Sulfurimonas sp.]|jgi:nickel/cobalt exporter